MKRYVVPSYLVLLMDDVLKLISNHSHLHVNAPTLERFREDLYTSLMDLMGRQAAYNRLDPTKLAQRFLDSYGQAGEEILNRRPS